MKAQNVKLAQSVRVVFNTNNPNRHQWAKIVAPNGKILHTGQVPYIKRVARKKFNLLVG
jgi:hypothetical protein